MLSTAPTGHLLLLQWLPVVLHAAHHERSLRACEHFGMVRSEDPKTMRIMVG